MKSLRAALVFIGVAGIAVGLFTLAVILTSDRSDTPAADGAIVLVVGWSFIGTGLFAWWRRPMNRTGGLMTAVRFAWFLGPLSISDVPGIFVVGIILLATMALLPPMLQSLFGYPVVTVGLVLAPRGIGTMISA